MLIQVVIVNYERPEDTIACVSSLLNSNGVEIKIVVIDNGSRDGSPERIRRSFPGIEIEVLPTNTGFTGGFNYGIECALRSRSNRILLTNNDTIFAPQAVAELSRAAWSVAIPKILFFDRPNTIWAAGCRWRKFPPSVVMRGYRKTDSPLYDHPIPLDFSTGCVMMIERNVLETVGGFDPDYQNYMEDYDFSARVREAGFTLGFVPSARVLHKVSQTLGIFSRQQAQFMGRNTVLFFRKNKRFSTWQLWTFLVWITMREMIHGKVSYIQTYWSGIRDGFNLLKHQAR